MRVWRVLKVELWSIVLMLLGACSPMITAQGEEESRAAALEILVPTHGQRIGEGDDPLCPASEEACYKIRAEGRVPDGFTPFFGVEPVKESPTIWIQPTIRGIRRDGTFAGLIYLGEKRNGMAEHFKIYLLACEDEKRFHTEATIRELPADCLVSDPVEVYRTR